jgi:uncharacterized integral membrane protein
MIQKIFFLFFFLFLVFGVSAQEDEPITLYGVNFDMDEQTIKKTLSKRFNCKFFGYHCRSNTTDSLVFASLSPGTDTIIIYCQAWDGCGLNANTVYDALVKEKYLKYSGGKMPEGEFPCMIGFLGEEICVGEIALKAAGGVQVLMFKKNFRKLVFD